MAGMARKRTFAELSCCAVASKWLRPLIVALLLVGCVKDYAHAPLTEASYEAAARHCHSPVLRLIRKPQVVFGVSGLLSARAAAPYLAQIECVRAFLGVAKDDVIIMR